MIDNDLAWEQYAVVNVCDRWFDWIQNNCFQIAEQHSSIRPGDMAQWQFFLRKNRLCLAQQEGVEIILRIKRD